MKNFAVLLIASLFIQTSALASSSAVCTGDVLLSRQVDVDAFNCEEITGTLTITGDDISNLSGLSSLKKVGNLIIKDNPMLADINGLSSLTEVRHGFRLSALTIANNPALQNLFGFNSLQKVSHSIHIVNNESLLSISGFPALTSLQGSLYISGNRSLKLISGFAALLEMVGSPNGSVVLSIDDNPSLEMINGFSALGIIQDKGAFLQISNNKNLKSIDGFSKLNGILGDEDGSGIAIMSNNNLLNIDFLSSLNRLGWRVFGSISIADNASLQNLDGLSSLIVGDNISTETLSIKVLRNPLLLRCCGLFPLLESIGNDVLNNSDIQIEQNGAGCTVQEILDRGACATCDGDVTLSSQADVDAFHCEKIAGNLVISGNNIVNLDSLASLHTVTGSISIKDNPSLININSFRNLGAINGTLEIRNNNSLSAIQGFDVLQQCEGISINDNPGLSAIDGFGRLTSLWRFSLIRNPALLHVRGLSSVAVMIFINIENNVSLTSVDAFSGLTQIAKIDIINNTSLTSLNGFRNVETIRGSSTGAYLIVKDNSVLSDLAGFTSLKRIDGDAGGASLQIINNRSLVHVNGLRSLEQLGGNNGAVLAIENNEALKDIDGLESLLYFGGGPQNFVGEIKVIGNKNLENIDGLASISLEYLGSFRLNISDNPSLDQCSGIRPLLLDLKKVGTLNHHLETGLIKVFSNGASCTVNEIIADPDCYSDTYEGDLKLSTQEEVDNFHYSKVTGTLFISGSDVKNINALQCLRVVGNGLNIEDNPNLQSLEPLSFIDSIGGRNGGGLWILRNEKISELNGFDALRSVSMIFIEGNNALKELGGFQGLKNTSQNFTTVTIKNNTSLKWIGGFSQLKETGGISISGNSSLKIISGFRALESIVVGELEITKNQLLESLNGFASLREIHPFEFGGLRIIGNAALTNLDGLKSLQVIQGSGAHLNIGNNIKLTNVDGLSSLTGLLGGGRGGTFSIYDNPSLKNLNGFSSLKNLQGGILMSFYINNNWSLESIEGISGLEIGGGNLTFTVSQNPKLNACDALYKIFVRMGWARFEDLRTQGRIKVFDNGNSCSLESILARNPPVVASFNLIDKSTGFGQYIQADTATLDVASTSVAFLRMEAFTFPGNTGSVEFILDKQKRRMENGVPYEFNLPPLALGNYTVQTKVFSEDNKQGKEGIGRTLIINVVNSASITGLDLVDLSGNVIKSLSDGDQIYAEDFDIKAISIRANVSESNIDFVKFYLNDRYVRTEYYLPYALNGDNDNGYLNAWQAKPGDYKLVVVPYVKQGDIEYAGQSKEVRFEILKKRSAVEKLYLINTETDQVISELVDGARINIKDSTFKSFTIIAKTSGRPGSVEFFLNGKYFRTETYEPYTMTGDNVQWLPTVGEYKLRVVPFSKPYGKGEQGRTLQIRFSVVSEDQGCNESVDAVFISGIGISVFPVPFKEVLNVAIDSESKHGISVTLKDSRGYPVSSKLYFNKENFLTLQTSDLSTGIFFLEFHSNGVKKIVRIVRE